MGAEKTFSFHQTCPIQCLLTFLAKKKQLILADQSRVAVKAETSAIKIRLGHLECKIKRNYMSKLECGYNCWVKLVMATKARY